MNVAQVEHITKAYADKVAVNDLSFEVEEGEIFGLIGPNGAGKSTTIRMMMNIMKSDHGSISILGRKLDENSKDHLGYLPEERGFYKKLSVMESITYLAGLKGLDRATAEKRAEALLEKTGMASSKLKKNEELSKGMGQLIQFIIATIHEPDLVVLDEPFTGLDPANIELLKGMIEELRVKGTAVIMSTHRMNEVERLCDRLLMINKGKSVLYGSLSEIRTKFAENRIFLDYRGDLTGISGFRIKDMRDGFAELELEDGFSPQAVLAELVGKGIVIDRFERAAPNLHEIFIKMAGE